MIKENDEYCSFFYKSKFLNNVYVALFILVPKPSFSRIIYDEKSSRLGQ